MVADVNHWGTTTEQVGIWIGCFCAVLFTAVMILTGMNQYRQWAQPKQKKPRSPDDRPVRHGEFTQWRHKVDGELKELEADAHKKFHDLTQRIQDTMLLSVKQRDDMRTMIDEALEPVEKKLDELTIGVTKLATKLEGKGNATRP